MVSKSDEINRVEIKNYQIRQRRLIVTVDLKKLVTFIAGVINATMEGKSKTDRIQIIVKAAVHHLDIRELTWEEVGNELSNQASQEQVGTG